MVNRFIITTIIVFASVLVADNSVAAKLGADANAAAAAVLRNYLPGTSGLGPIRVDCVDADDAARVLRVECNENCATYPCVPTILLLSRLMCVPLWVRNMMDIEWKCM